LSRNEPFQKTSYTIEVPAEGGREEHLLVAQDIAPCRLACPVGINVKGYVTAIAEEEFEKALAIIREQNCLPSVCGRVCTHPCERECTRNDYGGAIGIRALKRFVCDYERKTSIQPPLKQPSKTGTKIAVVGAGPAGIAAASELARLGHAVTVFEKEARPGGLMTQGIPEFRLPAKAVAYDIDRISRLSVTFRMNSPIDSPRRFNELRKAHDAVLLATGAHKEPGAYRISSSDVTGIVDYIEFMKQCASGTMNPPGKAVAVTGLGQSALDTARMVLRAGSGRVVLIYPRTRDELQAFPEETETAAAEDVEILYLTRPVSVMEANGKVTGIRCVKMRASDPDKTGRRQTSIVEGSEFTINCDAIIPVEPHFPDVSYLPARSSAGTSRWGYLKVDPRTLATGEPGVFAAGDMVTGPKSVIEAMAAGKRAALSIDAHLRHKKHITPAPPKSYPMTLEPEEPSVENALSPQIVPWKKGLPPTAETEQAYGDIDAVDEARRCLRCGPCMECVRCSSDCSKEIVMMRPAHDGMTPVRLRFQKRTTDKIILAEHRALNFKKVVTVPPEIATSGSSSVQPEATFCVVDPDLCMGCGACEEICEYSAPRVEFLNGRFTATIHRDICRECGTCAAHCPSGAIRQQYFTDEFIDDEIERIIRG
jgi:NADPH-dependent glutamate synthase beta subunit-like oxidoreductase/ferredoxin